MTDELRWYLLTKKRAEGLIATAFRIFRQHSIEPVLIKGWAAARNYPADRPRIFGDIDLAVSSDDFEKAGNLIKRSDSGIMGVDLHRELRHLDTLDWKTLLEASETVSIEGEAIRLLSPEDHFRILCVHWLTDGGESRERLWDVYYAVANRKADFDWARCLDVVSPNRRGWIIATIGLAHRYLELNIDDLPFADEARRLPAWLTKCVERGWKNELPMQPLHTVVSNTSSLVREIRKRVPPNPIQATVDCEGAFDHRSRIGYQFRDVFIRIRPAIPRVWKAVLRKKDR